MMRLTEIVDGRLCVVGMRPENESEKLIDVVKRLAKYEDIGYAPKEIKEILKKQNDFDYIQKAFALACRMLAGANWAEQRGILMEFVRENQVCRICGCTQNNACFGGCSWVEEDLCSSCKSDMKE